MTDIEINNLATEDYKESVKSSDEDDIKEFDPYKDFPKCSKTYLKRLKDVFDIRKMIRYSSTTKDYLQGVQDVLDFIEMQNNKR